MAKHKGACTAVALAAPVRGPWDPTTLSLDFLLPCIPQRIMEKTPQVRFQVLNLLVESEFKCGGWGGGSNHGDFVAATVHSPSYVGVGQLPRVD